MQKPYTAKDRQIAKRAVAATDSQSLTKYKCSQLLEAASAARTLAVAVKRMRQSRRAVRQTSMVIAWQATVDSRQPTAVNREPIEAMQRIGAADSWKAAALAAVAQKIMKKKNK